MRITEAIPWRGDNCPFWGMTALDAELLARGVPIPPELGLNSQPPLPLQWGMQLYLSRNTKMYGGGYMLSTFMPEPSPTHTALSWFYYGRDEDLTLPMRDDDARKLQEKAGKTLELGEVLNLVNGEVIKIESLPRDGAK